MRYAIIWAAALLLGTLASAQGAIVRYRLGAAPKPAFQVAGQTFKIDPNATHTQRVRALKPEEFDPIQRHSRVPDFYHRVLKEHYDEAMRLPRHHCGPFRWEFIYWTYYWPMHLRALWAYHHRRYIEEALWARWMAEVDFAAEIRRLEAQNLAVQDGYIPAEYASTPTAMIYSDEYLDAAYNPIPFLAVMTLTNLKADPQSDWIGKAAGQSLVAQLSALPGMFVVESKRVSDAITGQRKIPANDLADPTRVAQVGRSLDAEQVVMGNYVADGDKVLFNLRIVDAETGKVISGISKSVPRDHLLDALPEFATALAGALNPAPPATAVAGSDPAERPTRTIRTRSSSRRGNQLPEGAVETEMVGGHGGGAFVHVDPAQHPVLGFRYSFGHWSGRDVMRTLDPIFANTDAPQAADDPRTRTVLGREGYVVGGLIVDTDGINAVAVRVVFVRLKDGRPDLATKYASDWIGTPSRISVHYLAGHGERVLGTFGHKGLNLDAVGLVLAAADNVPAPNHGN
jgi:TolB-like protein